MNYRDHAFTLRLEDSLIYNQALDHLQTLIEGINAQAHPRDEARLISQFLDSARMLNEDAQGPLADVLDMPLDEVAKIDLDSLR